ncbi:MAG: S8 family serine peptidase [Deinococcales bacterium]
MTLRHALRVTLLAALLAALLVACNVSGPTLGLSTSSIHMVANSAGFLVSNTGDSGSILNFTTSSSNPAFTMSPASGAVSPGTPVSVTVTVDPSALSGVTNVAATVSVTSNGGSGGVTLDYGIGTCGSYTPQSLARQGARVAPGALAPGAAAPASRAPAPDPADIVPGQIIVGYNAPAGAATAALRTQALAQASLAVRSAYGLTLLAGGTGEGPDLVSAADVPTALARLRADPRVRYAQRNLRLHLMTTPNDQYFPANAANTLAPEGQWNLRNFGLPAAWNIETGTSNPVVIAVIDDGVWGTHEDFQNPSGSSKILPGWDFLDGVANTMPGTDTTSGTYYDHGTHVAGIAAAVGNNTTGVAGVAYGPEVSILPIKIFGNNGAAGTLYELADAIRWAAGLAVSGVPANQNPADVINMSLGTSGDQPVVDVAAQDAWNAGAVLVAAAGNHGTNQTYVTDPGILSPANAPCVIAVGSVDGPGPTSTAGTDPVSTFSNTGPQLEVAAPGRHRGPAQGTESGLDAYADPRSDRSGHRLRQWQQSQPGRLWFGLCRHGTGRRHAVW